MPTQWTFDNFVYLCIEQLINHQYMETSPTYIISDVSFILGRFEPIFNYCPILRKSLHQIHESLQCCYFSDYISVVDFIRNTLEKNEKNDSPFRFFLDSIRVESSVSSDIDEYVLLKVVVNVS